MNKNTEAHKEVVKKMESEETHGKELLHNEHFEKQLEKTLGHDLALMEERIKKSFS